MMTFTLILFSHFSARSHGSGASRQLTSPVAARSTLIHRCNDYRVPTPAANTITILGVIFTPFVADVPRCNGERFLEGRMTHAIRFRQTGGPDVLEWEEVAIGKPAPAEVRLRHTAIGLNYIDTYHRTGLYPVPLPSGIGIEAAGIVEAVGANVKDLKPGDRVAYAGGPLGAYAEVRVMPAERLVKLPKTLSDRQAAAVMLKGMTAEYLLRRTYKVRPGDTILIHAAAGGVGLLMCQWAKALGATVIGTVSSNEKAALAKAHGCRFPIVTTHENFVDRVHEITRGQRLPVVYDSVGKDTFMGSLDCLVPRGLLVMFGNASGAVPPFDLGMLSAKGSLFVTRPTLVHYTATRQELQASAKAVFKVVGAGTVKIAINQTYALHNAAHAHRDLEARKTTGSTVLVP
jgi:NADPH2:quinone reductase